VSSWDHFVVFSRGAVNLPGAKPLTQKPPKSNPTNTFLGRSDDLLVGDEGHFEIDVVLGL
jgi:hypothetical protein